MGKRGNKSKDFLNVSVVTRKSASTRSQAGDSDVSDLESIAQSSIVGDPNYQDDEMIIPRSSFEEFLDSIMDKKNSLRIQALDRFIHIMRTSIHIEEIKNYVDSLADAIEKNLHNQGEIILRACTAAALFSVQTGDSIDSQVETICRELGVLVKDHTMSENVRSAAAQALSIIVILSVDHPDVIRNALDALNFTWNSFKTTSTTSSLFSAAVTAWSLVLFKADDPTAREVFSQSPSKLVKYLESTNVDIRIAAGEALAALYERGNDEGYDLQFVKSQHIKELLETLAQDSAKYHAKKDKRAQRFTFRQIIDIIYEDNCPEGSVNYGKNQVLRITSCYERLVYDALCACLQGSLNVHLQKNQILRDLFDLPEVQKTPVTTMTRQEKKEIRQLNNEIDKARKIQRNRQRDKKAY
ncbi:hypothetical protein FO519_002107 [Halicephalobus sp. NKZ332]|nr:hypothetical protein FO519_002107 [Halicephalobus sp. NKZ332]